MVATRPEVSLQMEEPICAPEDVKGSVPANVRGIFAKFAHEQFLSIARGRYPDQLRSFGLKKFLLHLTVLALCSGADLLG